MDPILFHIDVNSAFLSWSAAEKIKEGNGPDLRTIPSIIGGDRASRHGIVLAKSTPAKAYGIVTGEPVAAAFRKCPVLIMEPPNHKLYKQRSQELMTLLRTYTSDLEQLSIDECFLDYSPIAHNYPSPMDAALQIKEQVHNELGFTVNIGISCNKLLAKMASDFQKPNRIHTLFPDEVPVKMWPLPVDELYMVGHASASRLHELGIHTIGELAHTDQKFLSTHFKSHGLQMWHYANGIDSSAVRTTAQELKGIGNSITLSTDAVTEADAKAVLLRLSETVFARLKKAGVLPGSVTVEIKYSDFNSCSHQMSPLSPVRTTNALYQTACQLFHELWNGSPIRLLGIRTTKLFDEHTPTQLSLFDLGLTTEHPADLEHSQPSTASPSIAKQQKVDAAMEQIRQRFGQNAVMRGSFLKPDDAAEAKN